MKTRAAVFARKSTEQNVDADAKSVTRQLELGRDFARSKGWGVVAEYSDDGVSGRLKNKLVQRNKMLAAATNEEFDVLVMRDLDRLSRNDEELPSLLYMLRNAGVEVWCYADGQKVDTKTALNRLTVNIKSFAASHEAEVASKRTREQKLGRYAKTANVDGKVYGYHNVGEPKSRRREILPKEAAIVRRIFQMSADGHGLLRIVRTLNSEKIPSPTGRGWCTSGVREMLRRDLYRGISIYGKTKWEWRDGGKFKVDVPENEWLRVPVPELRIIDEALWRRVQERLERTRETYPGRRTNGQLQGRREAGLISNHLLAGFLRCGTCGGNLIATARSGRGGVKRYWICTVAHHRGQEVCANTKGIPYEALTEAVVVEFKQNFLNPVTLGQILMRELEAHTAAPQAAKEEAEGVRREIARLDQQLARLVEAIADGDGDAKILKASIVSKEREQRDLRATLEHLDGLQQAAENFDLNEWLDDTRELLADTKAFLESGGEAGRKLLRHCLATPFTVSSDGEGGWTFEGEGLFVPAGLNRLVSEQKVDVVVLPKVPAERRKVQGGVNSNVNANPLEMVPPG